MGLLDQIPEEALRSSSPDLGGPVGTASGRFATTVQGRVLRFGWKGDVVDIATFVAQACEHEMGLQVPGTSENPDLDAEDLLALQAFVASLPRPHEEPRGVDEERGAFVFEAIGCAECHTANLADIEWGYSDLMLHDMGERNASSGLTYGGSSCTSSLLGVDIEGIDWAPPAERTEWRTPPL